ncbi:MAG: hypothetical protein IIC64_17685 [SAR324 cluster bacterium]|nr:hypothetical protein [SAR324 cluster bacterium]
MKFFTTIFWLLLVLLAAQLSAGPAALAQGRKPVMENVFFNVIWGSAIGGVLGLASTIISADDKSAPDNARSAVFSGATVGGLVGLGVGLWVIYQGTTFEGAEVNLAKNGLPVPSFPHTIPLEPPLVFLTSPKNPSKIIGFRATLFRLKF